MMDLLRIAQNTHSTSSPNQHGGESFGEKTLMGIIVFGAAQILKHYIVDPHVAQLVAERAQLKAPSRSHTIKYHAAEVAGRALGNEAVVLTLGGALYEAGKLLVSAIERRASISEQTGELLMAQEPTVQHTIEADA